MGATELLLAFILAGQVRVLPGIDHFPSPYFDKYVRQTLQQRTLRHGYGPTSILRVWEAQDLSEDEQISILVGSAAFHDPSLLKIYMHAMKNPSQRVRQAAAYGYRDLIGDRIPDATGDINKDVARRLLQEMDRVRRTLVRVPLASFWLDSVLAHNEQVMPGHLGISLSRSLDDALWSLGRIVTPEDANLLVAAYPLAGAGKGGIRDLLERLMLKQWMVIPHQTGRQGWSPQRVGETARRRGDRWVTSLCAVDYESELKKSFAGIGVTDIEPTSGSACPIWFGILNEPRSEWWPTAARFLYRCDFPPSTLMEATKSPEDLEKAKERLVKQVHKSGRYEERDGFRRDNRRR
ncbi:MAG: hypothetical protein GY906_14110 [bacterium]|nr:hypothetical protein [bacterium]